MKKLLIIFLLFLLTSCTATEMISTFKELRVAFENTDNKAIDSIKVTSPELLFSLYNNGINRSKELKKNGYFVSYTYDSNYITIRVQRKDSVLYFYKK